MDIKEELKHVPPWAYVAAGGGVLLLIVLRGHGARAGRAVATPASAAAGGTDTSGLPPVLAGSGDSGSTVPPAGYGFPASSGSATGAGGAGAATAATAAQGYTFAQALNQAEVNAGAGAAGTSSLAAASRQTHDLGYVLEQYQSSDPGYASWASQEFQFQAGGLLYGNQQARDAWTEQGHQYLNTMGTQYAPGFGAAAGATPPPPPPQSGGGGGGAAAPAVSVYAARARHSAAIAGMWPMGHMGEL